MQITDSKSLLAKLMATENLQIEQKNVPTACFDVKTRILTIPVLDKNISGHLYDLFIGHEVGHALYTPLEGMAKAQELKLPRSIVNMVEDARIERKIKYSYPGLRNSFVKGYKELVEKDFFEIQGCDLNDLSFADRANLYFKGGAGQGIRFNDEEMELINAIDTTSTYDDVLVVSEQVTKYMKKVAEEQEAQKLAMGIQDEIDEYDDEEYADGDSYAEMDANFGSADEDDTVEETESEMQSGKGNESLDAEDGTLTEEQLSSGITGSDYVDPYDDIKCRTDEALKQNEKRLFAENAKDFVYGNVPKVDINKAILGYKQLWKKYQEQTYPMIDLKGYTKFRKESSKVVSYLAKEFELRKNADQMKRASIAKTGELNMNKVFAYKFSEDIFKKMTVVPDGKSHGLVMFLDWSGSMKNHMENTMKQLLSLVMFCKKVNIPYEVYAFAQEQGNEQDYRQQPVEGDIELKPFQLLNLLSSRMSAGEFTYAASALCHVGRDVRYAPHFMRLGGTPLSEAIISAMEIIPQFQKQYRLQIVNSVFLTDGEGFNSKKVYREYEGKVLAFGNGSYFGSNSTFVITDPLTKRQEKVDSFHDSNEYTSAYINLLKARTGCNVLGFYVLSGRDFGKYGWRFMPKSMDMETMKINFRKNKYVVSTSAGFDEYYLLRSEGLDTEEDNELEVKENATTRGLVSAFSKYAGGKVANRVVLNRFIGLIA